MMQHLRTFSKDEIIIINNVVSMAEELVSNHYKMSASEWLRPKYDVKTLAELAPGEIVDGPFAQIVRYEGHRKDTPLGSGVFDYYKICLQDHAIHATLKKMTDMQLFPFCLYIVTHELIHIVRFSKFLQSFDASPSEKLSEEKRVHESTHQILHPVQVSGMEAVFDFYNKWRQPIEGMRNS
ncbi:MAG: hypothetical protein JRE88_15620 [Deltaproteobacteria bacterium]|nr:hypothetical protein [Deltaproteobacteria bacterium]